ncbi:MAG TPA: hypothetical protein VF681_05330 [Abditibacteriaceae bacterium]|jgi:hypothetical protein
MYKRALRFAAVGALLLTSSQAFAASDSSPLPVSSVPTRAVPADVKISLDFLTDAVAGGAFPTPVHQAEFEVRAIDGKGKPRSGVEVGLPVIISGGKGSAKEGVTARVTWTASSARHGHATALTGKDGVARGIFTSGNRVDEIVVLQVPGTKAMAEIKQLWDDCGEFEDTEDFQNNLVRVRFKLRLPRTRVGPDGKPNRVQIPITGHPMELELSDLTTSSINMALGPDEDGDGKPDGEYEEKKVSSTDGDLSEWKRLQQFIEISKVAEVEPGIYEGVIRFTPPKNEDGEEIFSVSDWTYTMYDHSVHDLNGEDTLVEK